jgi:anti-sigma regulatory factor (Ser/Thr protein kinase)
VEIVLTNKPEEKQRLLAALEQFAQANRLPRAVVQAADLALEEHVTNILHYAYDDLRPHEILVRFTIEQGQLQVEVEDSGKPFNPLDRPETEASIPLESKPIGGLGIHLIRKFMDDVHYRRERDKNILRMHKRLNSPAGGKLAGSGE